jgi:hypothetical protein
MSRANLLLEMADQWIGLTEGLQMERHQLSILLSQYHLCHEQLQCLITEVERLMSQIAGTANADCTGCRVLPSIRKLPPNC